MLSYAYRRIINLSILLLCAKFVDVLHATSAARRSRARIVQDATRNLPSAHARKKKKNKRLGPEFKESPLRFHSGRFFGILSPYE